MAKYNIILNCQKCGKTLWFKYYKLPYGKTVCPICYADYERPLTERKLEEQRKEYLREKEERERQLNIEKVEIKKDGEINETTKEPKDKTKISGTSPMTKEAMVYFKKYKKVVIVSGILIILLLVSTASVFFYEQNQISSIHYEYSSLKNDFNSLQSQYDTKKADYDFLSSNYNSLQSNYNSMSSKYNSLLTDYNSLQSNYNSIQSEYSSYEKTVTVRYGQEADCEQFVTPNDSSVISATMGALDHSSDGDLSWNDMTTINNWVGKNIQYNYDTFDGYSEDCWFYPSETLSRKYGDCEDHALLMVSMCKAEGSAPWLWCAEIKLQDGSCHMCVFVKVDSDQLYIFDPTSKPTYFFGLLWQDAWHSSSSKSESAALEEYRQILGTSSIDVLEIFNENEYHVFNNNQEFYNYF